MKKLLLLILTISFSLLVKAQTAESYLKSAIEKQTAGDNDGAVADCNKVLEKLPGDITTYGIRALSKYNLGLYQDAVDDYTRILRSDPKNAVAYNYRASAEYNLAEYKEAIKDCTEAIKHYSKYVSAYNNRANAKVMLEFYDEALADFNQSIALNPANAVAYCNRAFAKNKVHKYKEAIADCDKALSLDRTYAAGAYRNRGNAKIGLAMYEEGIKDCDQAIALEPQNAKAYNYRGFAYYKLGKYDLAVKDDDLALENQKEHDLSPFYEYREDAELKVKKNGPTQPRQVLAVVNKPAAPQMQPATKTIVTTPETTPAPPKKEVIVAEVNKPNPPAESTKTATLVDNKTIAPSDPTKPAPAAETTATYVNLDWLKPVDDFSSLPDGTLKLVENNEITVKIKAKSNKPLDKENFHLFVNGEDISNGNKMTVADIEELKRKGATTTYNYYYSTTLKVGINKSIIKLTYGNVASDELTVIYAPTDINLHVLAIGTHAQGLKYPEKDARDFANVFTTQKGEHKLFHDVSAELLLGDDAKAVSMAEKIVDWGNKQYNERDVLMLFISSHGFTEDGRLLITGSDFKSTSVRHTTVDFKREILEPLESINCKKFIFIDACKSGAGVSEGGKATEADVANEISKMANSGNGITIISSSSSTEQSWEDDSWGNGAFTKAIKEALVDMKADKDENGLITMNELYDYIRLRVAQLVKLANKKDSSGNAVSQTPKMYNPRGNVSIYLADKK